MIIISLRDVSFDKSVLYVIKLAVSLVHPLYVTKVAFQPSVFDMSHGS